MSAFGTRGSTLAYSVLWQTAVPVVLGLILAIALVASLFALVFVIRRSPGKIAGQSGTAELTALRDPGPLNYVIFLDDTFTIHHPWVREFCKRYGSEFHVPLSINARVETVTTKPFFREAFILPQ